MRCGFWRPRALEFGVLLEYLSFRNPGAGLRVQGFGFSEGLVGLRVEQGLKV